MRCQNPINWNFLLENPQDPSTNKIVCDLPPKEGSQGSSWFNLILKVDGEDVPNNFNIRYRGHLTPLIRSVSDDIDFRYIFVCLYDFLRFLQSMENQEI